MGKIVAIANQKGGVGKTTTAVNLSAALSIMGKRVLLVDMDPQGNACAGLGIDRNVLGLTVYNVLLDDTEVKDTVLSAYLENLFVIPSNADLVGAQIELVNEIAREYRLKNALDKIRADYDFIFIDCPPTLGLLTLNAITAADSVLIPVQCEFYALDGVSELNNTINLVKKNLNTDLEIEGVLLTMYDPRTNLSADVVKEIVAFFKEKTYKVLIPRNVRLGEAPSHGLAIQNYDTESIGARSYRDFANEFLKRIEEK